MSVADPRVEQVINLVAKLSQDAPDDQKLATTLGILTAALVAFVVAAGLSEEALLGALKTAYHMAKKNIATKMH
jgi:hypothetical protein